MKIGERSAPRLSLIGQRLLERTQRVGVLALVVQQARFDERRQRQLRIGLVRELRFPAGVFRIVSSERDLREQLVRDDARPRVALGRHLRGKVGMLARLLQLLLLEQRRRGAEIPARIRRLQLDEMLVGVCGEIVPLDPNREGGELAPDVGHPGIVAQDLLQQRDGVAPLAIARAIYRRAIRLEDVTLVLRIGQRLAGRGRHVGLRADVAERLQPLARVGPDFAWRLNRPAGDQSIERAAQRLSLPVVLTGGGAGRWGPREARPGGRGPGSKNVFTLVRIALQIVQLLARRLDVSEPTVGERRQLAPAEVIARVHRLGVHHLLGKAAATVKQRLQRSAAQISWRRRLDEIEDRRHEVDVLHEVAHAPPRARVAFLLDDERHVDSLVVHEQPVLLLAVVAEPFSVIRQQDDRRPVVQLMRLQVLDQASDDFVGVRDLSVVGRVFRKTFRRRVRLVRLVEMEEEKRARGAGGCEPLLGDRFRRAAVALHLTDARVERRLRHLAVEEVESLADSRLLAQHEGRDDGRRRVPAVAEHLRQHPFARLDGEADVVAHAGLERQAPREQRGVGRQRLRRVRVGALEHDAVCGKRVDGGRLHLRVAVGRQMIGAQRVDRDEDDRSARRRRRARVAPSADGSQRGPERRQNQNERVAEGTGQPLLLQLFDNGFGLRGFR